MVIANSSGCSSVWGGSYGLSPFKKNRHGQGPGAGVEGKIFWCFVIPGVVLLLR